MLTSARIAGIGQGVAVWLGLMALAALVSGTPTWASGLVVAAAVPMLVLRGSAPAAAAPVVVAGIADPQLLPWAIAAVAVTWRAAERTLAPAAADEPQRQLLRSRRRGEQADVLVVRGGAQDRAGTERLLGTLRVTDGVEIGVDDGRFELRAVLDGEDTDRAGVERRIRAVVPDAGLGWARFPVDGVTLEVLYEQARTTLAEGTEARAERRGPVVARGTNALAEAGV